MGLNISYEEVTDTKAPKIAKCSSILKNWYSKPDDQREAICSTCPLECDTHGSRGCYPRMGSYGYVASLHDFLFGVGSPAADNPFVQLTKGGGFGTLTKSKVKECLESLPSLRDVLGSLDTEAAVGYINDKRTDEWIGAGDALTSFGDGDYCLSSQEYSVGVHRGHGIAVLEGSKLKGMFACRLTYYRDTDNKHAVALFSGPFNPDSKINRVKFERIPSLPRFAHLLDTFEKIATKALKHNLTVVGC